MFHVPLKFLLFCWICVFQPNSFTSTDRSPMWPLGTHLHTWTPLSSLSVACACAQPSNIFTAAALLRVLSLRLLGAVLKSPLLAIDLHFCQLPIGPIKRRFSRRSFSSGLPSAGAAGFCAQYLPRRDSNVPQKCRLFRWEAAAASLRHRRSNLRIRATTRQSLLLP